MLANSNNSMKALISNLILFLALAIAFSACGGNQTVNTNAVAPPADQTKSANGQLAESNSDIGKEKKPSEYPPLVSAVAQSDLKNMDGSTFKIADKKGTVLVINMWATWCGPCLAEMPAFVKMQETYGPQGFEILGLNTDDESETMMDDINKVIKDKGINYPVVFSDSKFQVALLNISKFNGIPQSFLVDADGNLRAVFKGANKENVVKMEQMVGELVAGGKSSASTTSALPSEPVAAMDKKL